MTHRFRQATAALKHALTAIPNRSKTPKRGRVSKRRTVGVPGGYPCSSSTPFQPG